MEITKTHRGFGLIEFHDRNMVKCSLQKSSLATEDAIWLGCNQIELKTFVPNTGGWVIRSEQALKEAFDCQEVSANTRMHLTVEQVKELLPHLIHFCETGNL